MALGSEMKGTSNGTHCHKIHTAAALDTERLLHRSAKHAHAGELQYAKGLCAFPFSRRHRQCQRKDAGTHASPVLMQDLSSSKRTAKSQKQNLIGPSSIQILISSSLHSICSREKLRQQTVRQTNEQETKCFSICQRTNYLVQHDIAI